MATTKPPLSAGIVAYLLARVVDNNGLTPSRFLEVMSYRIPDVMKVSTIMRESGRARDTVKSWIKQYRSE